MSFIDDVGPAYPLQSETDWRGDLHQRSYGMSLRDWFAGQALAGMASNNDAWSTEPNADMNILADQAYVIADAMIAARSKAEG